tara:strand:+ start:134 stop:430 length:297 start_codon:yes stop_codon:yes gene_type:complete
MNKERGELAFMVHYDTRSCMKCYLGKRDKKCMNKCVWRPDTNKPYSVDNMNVICCGGAYKLKRGKIVNGWKYDKETGLTTNGWKYDKQTGLTTKEKDP